MLIQDVMQRGVVVVAPETRLAEAVRLLQRRGIRHLPVLDQGALVGIISDRDVKTAMASGADMERLTAGDVMTRDVLTTAPMFAVEEAARVMVTERISALPVTEAGRLVGIVTETDILLLFVRAMGVSEPSSRLDVMLSDAPRALGRVVQTVEATGTAISSIMTLRSPITGMTEAVIRAATINPGPAIKALEAQGYTVRDSWRG
jgi:acetoin utilization protein AcuB